MVTSEKRPIYGKSYPISDNNWYTYWKLGIDKNFYISISRTKNLKIKEVKIDTDCNVELNMHHQADAIEISREEFLSKIKEVKQFVNSLKLKDL